MRTEQRIRRSYLAQKRYAQLLGLLLLLLFVLTPIWGVPKVEEELSARSKMALEHAVLDRSAVRVSLSGRDATVSGGREQASEVARAAELIGRLPGVRQVEIRVATAPAAIPFEPTDSLPPVPSLQVRDKSEPESFAAVPVATIPAPAIERTSRGVVEPNVSGSSEDEPTLTEVTRKSPLAADTTIIVSEEARTPESPEAVALDVTTDYTFRPATEEPEPTAESGADTGSSHQQVPAAPFSPAPLEADMIAGSEAAEANPGDEAPGAVSAPAAAAAREPDTSARALASTDASPVPAAAPGIEGAAADTQAAAKLSKARQNEVLAYLNQLLARAPGFMGGSSRLHPETQRALTQAAETLKLFPNFPLAIVAYAGSPRGGYSGRGPVSRNRTSVVVRVLVNQGVDGRRLRPLGSGRGYPGPHGRALAPYTGQIQFLSVTGY